MAVKTVCICAVQDPMVTGGAERLVDWLAEELRCRDYVVDVVQVPFSRWLPKTEIVKNCLVWRLLDLTESNGRPIDAVIATKFPSYLVRHPRKVVWLVHQLRQAYELHDHEPRFFDDSPADQAERQRLIELDSRLLPEAQRLFCLSRTVAERLERYNGLRGPVLHPPIHEPERFHAGEGQGYVLSVGRLDPLKRVDLLVRALALAPALRAVVVGTGPAEEDLHRLAEALGVLDRVTFAGHVPEAEMIDLYANCSAVYFAPYQEDYGFVTLEAFLSRKPVLTAPDSGGVTEFVRDGETGLVVASAPEVVAAGLSQLVGDRVLARRLGDAGYQVASGLSWDATIERLLG